MKFVATRELINIRGEKIEKGQKVVLLGMSEPTEGKRVYTLLGRGASKEATVPGCSMEDFKEVHEEDTQPVC